MHSVSSGQRILYRIRRSLIEGIEDAECPGLDDELRLQDEPVTRRGLPLRFPGFSNSRKRKAEEFPTPSSSKRHRPSVSQDFDPSFTLAGAASNLYPSTPQSSDEDAHGSDADDSVVPNTFVVPPSSAPSPAFSPASSIYSLPNQDHHYVPNTPVSPVRPAPTPSRPASIAQPAPVTISSDSSLALAVTESPPNLSPTSSQRSLPSRSPQASRPALPSPPRAREPLPSASASNPAPVPAPRPSAPSQTPASTPTPGAGKAWPHGKYVCEVAAGFRQMDTLMQDATVKQAEAFRRVFGVTYKKSTVCNHRKLWREAPPGLVEEWAARGRDEGASWSEFVRALEGREPRRVGVGIGAGAGVQVGGKGGGAFGAQGMMSPQAFGSPQGGVLSLGPQIAMPVPLQVPMQGSSMSPPAGGPLREEEPMGSLRPPEEEQQRFLGEWFALFPSWLEAEEDPG